MSLFRIGGQRVGILTAVQQLDGDDRPVVSEFGEPQAIPSVVWWDGCVVEMQNVQENQGQVVVTRQLTVIVGPVAGDQIPAVDDDGEPAPLAVADLKSDRKLQHDNRTYVMRGDAVLQKTIRGRPDHVECVCEHQAG